MKVLRSKTAVVAIFCALFVLGNFSLVAFGLRGHSSQDVIAAGKIPDAVVTDSDAKYSDADYDESLMQTSSSTIPDAVVTDSDAEYTDADYDDSDADNTGSPMTTSSSTSAGKEPDADFHESLMQLLSLTSQVPQIEQNDDHIASMIQQGVYTAEHASEQAAYDKYVAAQPGIAALLPTIREHMASKFGAESKPSTHENNAILLSNVVKASTDFSSDCDNNDKAEVAKMLKDRPDLQESDKEFKLKRTGFDSKADAQFSESHPKSILNDAKSIRQFVLAETRRLTIDPKSPSYCDPTAKVCDRRKVSGSCEARLPVEDQGRCGSCWAFAASHSLSLRQCMQTDEVVSYSEQQIIDCSDYECGGGHHYGLFKWLADTNHLAKDSDYPYYVRDRKACVAQTSQNSWKGVVDARKEMVYVLNKENIRYKNWVQMIKELVSVHGGLYFAINIMAMRYKGKKAIEHCEKYGESDHAVVLTGWDVDPDGREYWLFRNSWGSWWADKGYGKIYIDTDCAPDRNPFSNVDVISIARFNSEPYDNSKTPENAYRSQIQPRFYPHLHDKLNCTTYSHEGVHIKQAFYNNAGLTLSQCNTDATGIIKNRCENKDQCVLPYQNEIVSKSPTCSSMITVLWDCGDKTYSTPTPTEAPEVFDDVKVDVDCRYAKAIGGTEVDRYCADMCHYGLGECKLRPTVKCILDTLYSLRGNHECDLSDTIPVEGKTREHGHIVDCQFARGRRLSTDEYCAAKCEEIRQSYWCEEDDYFCVVDAMSNYEDGEQLTGRDCDLRDVWVKLSDYEKDDESSVNNEDNKVEKDDESSVNNEDNKVVEPKRSDDNIQPVKPKVRDNPVTPNRPVNPTPAKLKRNVVRPNRHVSSNNDGDVQSKTEKAYNCNLAYSSTTPYSGACVVHCGSALPQCLNENDTKECIKKKIHPSCDVNDIDSGKEVARHTDCLHMRFKDCQAPCTTALEKCKLNDFLCVSSELHRVNCGHYYDAWVL